MRTVVRRHVGDAEARDVLEAIVQLTGLAVPGLRPGLTHAFPSAEAVPSADLSSLGRPAELVAELNAYALDAGSRPVSTNMRSSDAVSATVTSAS
jgi:hypothetical protein